MNFIEASIANIQSQRICDHVVAAYVMVRYGFSPCIISGSTSLHPKSISKIKQNYLSEGNEDTFKKKSRKQLPKYILKNTETFYDYNELLILYVRFHCSDPSRFLDLSALLKAWVVFTNRKHRLGLEVKHLDVNATWFLSYYLITSCIDDDDLDSGRLMFSPSDNAFYYSSMKTNKALNNTGYVKIQSLKEIEARLEHDKN